VLTPSTVGTSSFGLLAKGAVDDQVDGRPLVVPGLIITPAWPNYGGNLNQVPAVANGKVYVASNQAAADLRPETGRELEVVEIAGARRLPSRSFQARPG